MLSHRDAASLFGALRVVIIDELHALASTKRGDLLALNLARLRTLAPIGLSATVTRPSDLAPSWSATRDKGARALPRSSRPEPGQRRISPSSTLTLTFPGRGIRRATRCPRSTRRSRPIACRSSSSTRARTSILYRRACCSPTDDSLAPEGGPSEQACADRNQHGEQPVG
jgi:hypothetical protein